MSRKGFGKVLMGVGLGLGLGYLFNPTTGAENRKKVAKKGKELVQKAKEIDLNEVKDKLVDDFNNLKETVKTMDGAKAKEFAKKKGKEIKEKADELLAKAKEKAEPAVEKTVKDLKKNLSDFLQTLSDKLED